ncbi:A/G-specific adenine glycosylase [Occallatibacter savannae]|uniref:A/G-specific adenine glycosylase n=1 Tax=Occallatibacter savannae TaxID=1002691 RepID=UPI000D695988|nr:A/G-specific adenine glycosylase [Occallatibacter savannae]
MRSELLTWYHRSRRDLPWRHTSDPYAIWVSEIMLQQTRVAVVIDRYTAFLQSFPTIQSLAEAGEQDVLALWSGLGYYRRARMLHKAAKAIVSDYNGQMPTTAARLRELPGIGSYTAAAIASIAHSEPVAVVDGNVERVLSRIQGWHSHDTVSEAAVRRKVDDFAQALVDPRHPGDYNQAIMELGATVCTPRNPQCLVCPWASECRTLGEHRTPKRAAMKTGEIVYALVLRESSSGTEIVLEQRAATNSVMPGLWELPVLKPAQKPEHEPMLTVRHAIMQVNYTVHVHALDAQDLPEPSLERRWMSAEQASSIALTGLARKILTKAGLIRTSRNAAVIAPSPVLEVL